MFINLAYDKPAETIHPELTVHSGKMEQAVYQVTEGYYLAYGFGIASTHMIIGEDGVILIDPVEDVDKCRAIKAEFERITDKPVKAIIYTHMHADHIFGVGAFVTEDDVASGRCEIIAHDTMLQTLIDSSMNGVGRIMGLRSTYSFGNYLELGPEGRVNNGIGPDILMGETSFFAPTKTVGEKLEITIAGVQMEIFWVPSECDDEIAVWFPELKALCSAEVIQGESFPNLHTLRGTRYRDPRQWYKSIDVLRSFPAEFMVPSHGRPVEGREQVADVLTVYRDAIQFVHNQTIRYINKGCTPDELAGMIRLPDHLARHPWLGEFYGTVKHAVRQIYQGEMGWFNGDPTTLDPVPPVESASRHVELMGGRDTVLKAAEKSLRDDDYQWAAELATYLVRVNHDDMPARKIKAAALRQLGFKTINSNWRCWYLTSALELEGKPFENTRTINAEEVARAMPAQVKIEAMGLLLAAEKALDTHLTLAFHMTDLDESYALEIRQGIVQFHRTLPETVDVAVRLTNNDLSGPRSLEKGLKKGTIRIEGDPELLIRFFSYFDFPKREDEIRLTIR